MPELAESVYRDQTTTEAKMALYRYVRELWKDPKEGLGELWYSRLTEWRSQPATLRIERPTRIDRARSLGYKAKPGFIIIRQRVERGGRMRPRPAGRKTRHSGQRKDLKMSYQVVAEQRAGEKYVNCEVLNSYWAGEDGNHFWYEVILVDRDHPAIKADKNINWISGNVGRIYRGLTSAAKKSRGLRGKGKGFEKNRPSKYAVFLKKQKGRN